MPTDNFRRSDNSPTIGQSNPLFQNVLRSNARHKIVVGGPGTGKTYLFKEFLKDGKKRALTLTFINSLVEDLSLELYGLSDVRTLHSFARSILAKAKGVTDIPVYAHLPKVIQDDLKILSNEEVNFEKIFHEMDEGNPHIAFYKRRQTFYAHHGFADLVYDAVKYLSDENQKKRIPAYDQIFVDEFQDFNELEVRLIDILAETSPILLAGDDDQALYFGKQASTKHIRNRYNGIHAGYEPFTLDLCCRCTGVIVRAFNDIVKMATEHGFLKDRIPKKFDYMDHEIKNMDCSDYPKITHVSGWYANAVPFVVEMELTKIAAKVQSGFSVLLVAPSHFCFDIAQGLIKKGFSNVIFSDEEDLELSKIIDALEILAEPNNGKNNLGWRIICQHLLNHTKFGSILSRSSKDIQGEFINYVDRDIKQRVRQLVALFRRIKDPREQIGEADLPDFLKELGMNLNVAARHHFLNKLSGRSRARPAPGLKNISIKISTITRAKGLSEDFVFVVHFDDRSFLEGGKALSDQKICSFLVALTRARKKVILVSCTDGTPTFLKWIAPERIETVKKHAL
jgi:hypothetical protein